MQYINTKTFAFLREISQNNNRVWFTENKQRYLDIKTNLEVFASYWHSKIMKVNKDFQNPEIKPYIFRIYRDARFAKGKPYKDNFGILLVDGGRSSLHSRAGFYLHIENGNCFLVGGAYMPDNNWLENIRKDIAENPNKFKKIIENEKFKELFTLEGRKLKTAPRGYSKYHKEINLINNKDFYAFHKFTDKELLKENFLDELSKKCEALFDFNDYLNRLIVNK